MENNDVKFIGACDKSYALYSSKKLEWIELNKGASQKDYEAAIRRIARECGV